MISKRLYTEFTYNSPGKDMRGKLMKKEIIFGIIILLISTSIIPSISGNTGEPTKEKNIDVRPLQIAEKTTTITFYVFGQMGFEKHDVIVSVQEATTIYSQFQELMKEQMIRPLSGNAQRLKNEVKNSLDRTGLSSSRITEVLHALSPPFWIVTQYKIPLFEKIKNIIPTTTNNATRILCSVGSEGVGAILPPILIPRPRIIGLWAGNSDARTSIVSFLPFGGVIASGRQMGVALGFIGLGASFAFPTGPTYWLMGYAIMIRITADSLETFP
jgi:hypothetical protein